MSELQTHLLDKAPFGRVVPAMTSLRVGDAPSLETA